MAAPSDSSRLRLWPGVVIVILQWLFTFGSGMVSPSSPFQFFSMTVAPALGFLLLLIWWFFLSRASRRDRIMGVVLPFVFLLPTFLLAHPSAPMGIFIYGIPILCLGFVLWALLTQHRSDAFRLRSFVGMLIVACGVWPLLRLDGVQGDMAAEFAWRWQPTAEERLLATEEPLPSVAAATQPDSTAVTSDLAPMDEPSADDASEGLDEDSTQSGDVTAAKSPTENTTPATEGPAGDDLVSADAATVVDVEPQKPIEAVWPGFRGPQRDGVISRVQLATDWSTSPPQELWKRPIGPGWSSMAIWKDRLFTQEQRGDDEVVSAYDATSGQPIWQHRDPVRFWEAMAGAGPRGTPTFDDGRIFALGATGLLNALDAVDGSLLWSRNAAEDSGATTPDWGFSSSPLVVDGLVVIHTGGPDGKGVAAYDATTGEPRWYAPSGPLSYSSLHSARLGDIDQMLILTSDGIASHAPADGTILWQHEWPVPGGGARIVQPVVGPNRSVLVGTGFGLGVRHLTVSPTADDWTIEERWTSNALKPYFNDFVLHEGHLYGFDGRIMAGVNLETGERVWKGGRYGHGQLLLLADQDLLLVLSDRGQVALVSATPGGFEELATMAAIEGKTWNHPVIADGVLYVRNAQEMAAFRLPQSAEVSALE